MTTPLFPVAADQVAMTTDEWYTPSWLFDAAGLMFDMDVAAPVVPELRTCPARRYLTVVEDGLTHPWEGVIWCNPPYSKASPWVDRWAEHPDGLILTIAKPEVRWRGRLGHAADAICFVSLDFGRPDHTTCRLSWCQILAARGTVATEALIRVARADPYAQGAYHVHPSR